MVDPNAHIPPDLNIPWWIQYAFAWLRERQTLSTLLTLIGIDIILGLGLSVFKKTLSSTICWTGIVKKITTLLIICAVAAVGPIMPQIPSFELACTGFIVAELISIFEAAAAMGVLPAPMVDVLLKLKAQNNIKNYQKSPISPVSQNVVVVNPAPSGTPNVGTTTTTTEVTHTPPTPHESRTTTSV